MKKKQIIIIAVLFCFFANTLNAQEKWQFRLSYGQVYNAPQELIVRDDYTVSHFRVDVSREMIQNLHVGSYIGYSRLYTFFGDDSHSRNNAVFYGLNFRYQIMPLLMGRDNLRFELYPVAKVGFVTEFWSKDGFVPLEKERHNRTNFEYGLGLGAAFNVTRRLGVFGEGTFGQFVNDQNFRWHVGVKFNL